MDTWHLCTELHLPKKMEIVYRSRTGETKYKTILVCPSSDDVASAGQAAEVQDEASAVAPKLLCVGGKEAEDGPGIITFEKNVVEPRLETASEREVKQVIGKQGDPLIPEEPRCGGRVEDRDGSEVVVHEGCDAPPAQEIGIDPMDKGCSHDTANEDDLEELMKNRKAIREQYPDQISICSLE